MRIEQTADVAQAQGLSQHRVLPPAAVGPPRRVQAIGQPAGAEDSAKLTGAPPEDAITLDLSEEGREAARKAALAALGERARQGDGAPGEAEGAPREAQRGAEQELRELERKDRAIRAHEQALRAAAGSLSVRTPSYSYQVGPDGRLYLVDADLRLDTSEVPGDPEATLRKAEQLKRAALATTDSSPEERAMAAMAAAMAARARQELQKQQSAREEDGKTG